VGQLGCPHPSGLCERPPHSLVTMCLPTPQLLPRSHPTNPPPPPPPQRTRHRLFPDQIEQPPPRSFATVSPSQGSSHVFFLLSFSRRAVRVLPSDACQSFPKKDVRSLVGTTRFPRSPVPPIVLPCHSVTICRGSNPLTCLRAPPVIPSKDPQDLPQISATLFLYCPPHARVFFFNTHT